MQQAPLDVVVAAYRNEQGAHDALEDLSRAHKDGLIDIKDAAVLRRDMNGHLHIDDIKDKGFGRGALLGGVTGAVVGVIAGPIGWVTLGGAAVGGLAAKLRDGGFKDNRLRRIGENLEPGSSAIVAVIEHEWVRTVEEMIEQTSADVATEMVAADIADQLEREAGQQTGGARDERAA